MYQSVETCWAVQPELDQTWHGHDDAVRDLHLAYEHEERWVCKVHTLKVDHNLVKDGQRRELHGIDSTFRGQN